MVCALLFDFARVLLFPKDRGYLGTLTSLYHQMAGTPGSAFSSYYQLNRELLEFLGKIKGKYRLYLFTTGMTYKVPEAQAVLSPIFNKMYSVGELGLGKDDPKAFECIARDIGVPPAEILYIDDKPSYVETAKRAGFEAIQYISNEQLFGNLEHFFKAG